MFEKGDDYDILAGFVTTYKSYHSLDRYRARVSQFIILPQYQRQGLAYKLYETIYTMFLNNKKCFEVTMESPTDIMSKIQHLYILKAWKKAGVLDHLLNEDKSWKTIDLTNLVQVMTMSRDMKKKLSETAKCDKIKMHRNYEFIICTLINLSDQKIFEKFRAIVKKRFHSQFILDLMPDKRFDKLKTSNGRIKAPYLLIYDEEGECSFPKVDLSQVTGQESEALELKLETYFKEFMDQVKNLGSSSKLLKSLC